MPAQPKDQLAIDEKTVEDAALEAALNRRLQAMDNRAEINRVFRSADNEARGLAEALHMGVGDVIRIGRFRITKTETKGRSVAFETEPKEKISFGLVDE